jgi:hypothetical protein
LLFEPPPPTLHNPLDKWWWLVGDFFTGYDCINDGWPSGGKWCSLSFQMTDIDFTPTKEQVKPTVRLKQNNIFSIHQPWWISSYCRGSCFLGLSLSKT